jgi:hypothetical protein
MIDDAVLVMYGVVSLRNRLCHMQHTEPGNSSKDQCHAHDNYKLTSSADEQAFCRSHHLPDSLHIHIQPHRIPHKRLDRCENFAVLTHDAAPTKNFVFDSHWQQSRSVRWKCTGAKRFAHLQMKCVARGVVVRVLVCACRVREVRRETQLVMVLRWWDRMILVGMVNMRPWSCSCDVLRTPSS